jgi:hypothetical protein
MHESFVQYIWQHQYFDKAHLCTTQGEPVMVVRPGYTHPNGGPDFAQASIDIGQVRWHGSVEIHLRTSDWVKHGHQNDGKYNNVILHVVWQDDSDGKTLRLRADGTSIPVIELCRRVSPLLTERFHLLTHSKRAVACAPQWAQVSSLHAVAMLDKTLLNRLERKATEVTMLLQKSQGDWDATTFAWICRHFGFKSNNDAFGLLAQIIPFRILLKHSSNLIETEALLFGLSGWLEDAPPNDAYLQLLKRHYAFLAHKYSLTAQQLSAHQWQLLRLRPANFPTIRLAQLASLVHKQPKLLHRLICTGSLSELEKLLQCEPSDYWATHYLPARKGSSTYGALGLQSRYNLIINGVVALLTAYGMHKGEQDTFTETALQLLEQIPAENNYITRLWKAETGYMLRTAADSQAVIELYKQHCLPKACLRCKIGSSLLK